MSALWDITVTDTAIWTRNSDIAHDNGGAHDSLNEYSIRDMIGKGSYGTVNKCFRYAEGQEPQVFALKMMNRRKLSKNRQLQRLYAQRSSKGSKDSDSDSEGGIVLMKTGLDAIQNEISLWRHLYHRNIVLLYEVIDDEGDDYIMYIMEYMCYGPIMRTTNIPSVPFQYYRYYFHIPGQSQCDYPTGPLSSYEMLCDYHAVIDKLDLEGILSKKRIDDYIIPLDDTSDVKMSERGPSIMSEVQAAYHFYELMQGLEYLHSKGICHRDIKPDNLLINERHMLCVCDFNSAIQFDNSTNPCGYVYDTVGTPSFWCPESIKISEGAGHCDSISSNMYSAYEADIWAAGVCMYCFLYNTLPFQEVTITHSDSASQLMKKGECVEKTINIHVDNDNDFMLSDDMEDWCVNIENTADIDAECEHPHGLDIPHHSTHNDMLKLFDRICNVPPIFPRTITTKMNVQHTSNVDRQPESEIDDRGEIVRYISEDAIDLCSSMLYEQQHRSDTNTTASDKTNREQCLDVAPNQPGNTSQPSNRLVDMQSILHHPWLSYSKIIYNKRHLK